MTVFEIPNLRFSGVAAATVRRYRFVKVDANGLIVQAGLGEASIGATRNEAAIDQAVEINDGIAIVEASAAIAAGAQVQAAADGKAVTATTGGVVLGIVLVGAAAAGQFCTVKMPTGVKGAAGDVIVPLFYQGTDLAAGADLTAVAFGSCPVGYTATVVSAQVISQGTAAGIDDANTSAFVIKKGTDTVASVTFNTAVAFPAAAAAQALTLSATPANLALVAGDSLTIAVTNGATANLPLYLVQVMLKLEPAA